MNIRGHILCGPCIHVCPFLRVGNFRTTIRDHKGTMKKVPPNIGGQTEPDSLLIAVQNVPLCLLHPPSGQADVGAGMTTKGKGRTLPA